ncbi:hypothetical protein B0I28_113128 [Glycomyces artemisiae]|uniref:Excreted virulence factor EspC (Type VII ESX diderm) n=2 Tax=Glycomyces artemisiae TaxID=1076443 RepID=A0A2T0UAX7_9ACTN|nr:hypothetical protein B0I28_113128 [Glycomyces artemisiae]
MDYLGMNPNRASAGGDEVMTLAESYGSLRGDLMGTLEGAIAAAGEPEVLSGYEDFGEKWSTDLARTAAHGESVGGSAKLTVTDGVDTDDLNYGNFLIDPPDPTPPTIQP